MKSMVYATLQYMYITFSALCKLAKSNRCTIVYCSLYSLQKSIHHHTRSCTSNVIPYNTTNNSFIIIQFNWDDPADLDVRCYCALALINLTISSDIWSSSLCQETNTSTIYCEDICTNDQTICEMSSVDQCDTDENRCLIYGHKPYMLRNNIPQIFVVSRGLACNVIKEHAVEICRVLLTTPTDVGGKLTDIFPLLIGGCYYNYDISVFINIQAIRTN